MGLIRPSLPLAHGSSGWAAGLVGTLVARDFIKKPVAGLYFKVWVS